MTLRRHPGRSPRPFIIEDPCQRNGCSLRANFAPRLLIPPRGFEGFEPWGLLIGLEVCRMHFLELRARTFLNRAVIGIATEVMKRGGAEPDFERAYLEPVHVMASEYRKFRREQRGKLAFAG